MRTGKDVMARPKPGDSVERLAIGKVRRREVLSVHEFRVRYRTNDGKRGECYTQSWYQWCLNARVLKVAQ